MSKDHKDYQKYFEDCSEVGREEFYEELIAKGNNPGFAAMLAMQQPPGTKGTEKAFLEGQQHWADKLSPVVAKKLFDAAKKAGISTQGKKYIGGLGKASDPMAWISTQDDVRAVLKAKGLSSTGSINYKAPDQEFKKKALADDIVEDYAAREVAKDPALAEKIKKNPKKIRELKEKIIHKHTKGKK
jgi:hypothetical protein